MRSRSRARRSSGSSQTSRPEKQGNAVPDDKQSISRMGLLRKHNLFEKLKSGISMHMADIIDTQEQMAERDRRSQEIRNSRAFRNLLLKQKSVREFRALTQKAPDGDGSALCNACRAEVAAEKNVHHSK